LFGGVHIQLHTYINILQKQQQKEKEKKSFYENVKKDAAY
jgi:hypothetical protein